MKTSAPSPGPAPARRATPLRDPARVTAARERIPGEEEAQQLADGFKLLGEPTRVRMLFALLEAGELSVGDLAAAVGAGETAVSHALRLLRAAGIVLPRRDGRTICYRLGDAHVRSLLDLSREHLAHAPGREQD